MNREQPRMPAIDTSPEAETIQIDILRKAPVWKRLLIAGEMSEAVMLLSRLGVARRNPGASAAELRSLAAEAVLGSELAARVYGR
jgi:hypothetical protein